MSDDDWRVEVEVGSADAEHRGHLERVLHASGRGEGRAVADAQAAVGADVAVTHDGRRLFAYAASRSAITSARDAIESALSRDGIAASLRVSRWDEQQGEWRQEDPPVEGEQARAQRAADGDVDADERRTLVIDAGKLVKTSIEQTMREYAERLGLRCEISEHPHLLTTQVLFELTGPRRKIDEFRQALMAEGATTIRADGYGTGLI